MRPVDPPPMRQINPRILPAYIAYLFRGVMAQPVWVIDRDQYGGRRVQALGADEVSNFIAKARTTCPLCGQKTSIKRKRWRKHFNKEWAPCPAGGSLVTDVQKEES